MMLVREDLEATKRTEPKIISSANNRASILFFHMTLTARILSVRRLY
jgi:hypothetical protein